jgi:hypothetical protein
MLSRILCAAVLAAASAVVAGCSASPNPASPTSSTQSPRIDYFVGGWTSSPLTTTTTVNGAPSGCSQFDYNITKTGDNSANVTYDLACAGYAVKGTGAGVLQGSVLKWTANGTVSSGAISCPFTFTDSTATAQVADQTILVSYNATVCGIGPFSGSRVLSRR